MLRSLFCSAALVFTSATLFAQASPTTSPRNLQIGAGFSAAQPDYTEKTIMGVTGYLNYDVGNGGFVVEVHSLTLRTPQDIAEMSVLTGARYGVTRGRFHPYGKLLLGAGIFQKEKGTFAQTTNDFYQVFAAGAGLDISASRHINIRAADFEYQAWPSFAPHALTPWIATAGVAYHF